MGIIVAWDGGGDEDTHLLATMGACDTLAGIGGGGCGAL